METDHSENVIDQKAVGDLLCGYKFHIPPYQRGYRWTRQEIVDLCNDLLEYALRPKPSAAAFYSLQPLVVKYRGEKSYDVIDGQQRLTTIYILMRFLMSELGPTPERLKRHWDEANLYSIIYDTRDTDTAFMADLGAIGWEDQLGKWEMDIDIAHIYNAYQYMKEWLYPTDKDAKGSSAATCRRVIKEGMDPDEIARKMLTLLKNKKDTTKQEGNAQFIWYQLSADKDAIDEFITENKGKIGLTETEKIRALFLFREDKNNEVDAAQQIGIAKDWDDIEATLQDGEFWAFVSREKMEYGRIALLFRYLYNEDKVAGKTDAPDLYKYYEQMFAEKDGNVAMRQWARVLEAFRMIKNWHKDAYIFNLVGLLTREGVSLNDIAKIYYKEGVSTTNRFVAELCQIINDKCLPKSASETKGNEEAVIKDNANDRLGFKEGEMHLELNYNDHKQKVCSLMLFLNIHTLNEQIENRRNKKDKHYAGNEYRFAFDLYDDEAWDIEHIDSATTNQLKKKSEQAEWIETAESAVKHYYRNEYDGFLTEKQKFEAGVIDFKAFHEYVIALTDSEADNEERKNWVGNLTLLGAAINRSYGNAIFAAKCIKIDEKVNAGSFVPVCTRMVFYKALPDNDNAVSRLAWTLADKKAYHKWILDKVLAFKEKYPLKNKD